MYCQEHDDENSGDQKRVQRLFINGFARPRDQVFHFARRVKGRRRLKYDADLLPVSINGDNMVGERLVGAAVAPVFIAVAQQSLVKLADVVLGQAHIAEGLEHEVIGFSVSGYLLFVASLEGLDRDFGKRRLDLGVCEFRPFDARA
jgi:hypothetical protein